MCVVSVHRSIYYTLEDRFTGGIRKPSGSLDVLASLRLLFWARIVGSLRLAKSVKESGEDEFWGLNLGR